LRIWGKGAKERIGLMGLPAARALEDYIKLGRMKLEGNRETRALFLNRYGVRISERRVQHIVRDYARRVGLDIRVHPHMMRHTFATHLLDGGADLRSVQDLLGHAKLSSTQVYTHVSQNQIRRTYLAAHPRSDEKGEG
jgi:integrase/recombinase XerC